jgi:alpha-tubulin suppressor-like RCC1 family protein
LGQTTPPASLTNVVRVVGGFGHSVALTTAGQVVAWGDNRFGQLQVPVGLSGVVQIASGYAHTVALKDDGTVVGWGANYGTVYSI